MISAPARVEGPHRYPSRDAWLRARRIGSSDVAALLGLSRWATPYDVWERLVHGPVDAETTADQERGLRLEPRILATYAQLTGRRVTPTPPHTLYTRGAWASSTPDATADDGRLVEAKTDRRSDRWGAPQPIDRWTPDAAGVVRVDYYLQVQHQLWTLDREFADLAVLVPGEDPFLPELRVYPIRRDEEVVDRLVDRCARWWARHVVDRVPPELDEGDASGRALARLERSGSRRATSEEERLAAGYLAAAETEKRARDEKRRLGRELVISAGEARALELARGQVTIVTSVSASQLDDRALVAEHPELEALVASYRHPGAPYSYPRITVRGGRS